MPVVLSVVVSARNVDGRLSSLLSSQDLGLVKGVVGVAEDYRESVGIGDQIEYFNRRKGPYDITE